MTLVRSALVNRASDALTMCAAIWDNRSAFHCATFDYEGLGERFGHRVVGIGEKPYLDPQSTSRSEALGLLERWQ